MEGFDLLEAVQPEGGWFAVVGITEGGTRQVFVETREELEDVAANMVQQGRNVFFGVAKFKDDSSRLKSNVQALKAFWLDIDCGPGKSYETQAEGAAELARFTATVGLPRPIVVNSGRGLHVYWALTEAITREEWEPVAAKLRSACATHNLLADPACFEVARVLRIPGTFNFKGETPAKVEVLASGKRPISYAEIREILGVKGVVMPVQKGRGLSALAQQVQSNIENSFKKIMRRAEGCAQLQSCFTDRATISEPRWFDALSVAKFCVDKDTAIHKLSADHPDYDPVRTEQKLTHILGPHSCAEFEKNNPGVCAGCTHFNKIKSPISLGKEVLEATEEDNEVVATEANNVEEDAPLQTYHIPEYPFPFFRPKEGGIYRKPPLDDPEAEPILVYHRDFYIVKRMNDPQHGEVLLFRLHLPKDGVKEFVVPCVQVTEGTELRKALAAQGIMMTAKRFGFLAEYVIAAFNEIQDQKKAEQMRNQFGWVDRDSKFIIGDREVSVEGTFHSPPSSMTVAIAEHMTPVGSIDKWREVFNLYGKPGLEPHAFAAATAFGAPLLKFSGQSGAIINLIHPRSGTGKTTILHMCNSVWGNPGKLCARKDDTFNSKVHKMGVHCNLPICFDEMSNTKPEQLSELAYMITQGTGKDRMRSSANELRLNLTTWQTIALCSSNHSFYEKLEGLKNSPEGEMMRIMEYHLDYTDVLSTDYAKQMFDHQLMDNFGHAGEIYARYLISHHKEVQDLYTAIQLRFDTHLKLTQRERFWSATAAANVAGAYIAVQLGLCDWDLGRLFKWACKMIRGLRVTTTPPPESDKQVIGEFMLAHMQNILIVNDGLDRRTKMQEVPVLEPRQELMVRYEPDTMRVYITVRAFRAYCQLRNVSYRETLRKLKECGMYLKSDQKRMSKGMAVTTTPVQAMIFDASHPDFLAVEKLVGVAEESVEE